MSVGFVCAGQMDDSHFAEAVDLCYSVLDAPENFRLLGDFLCDVMGADACDIVRESKTGDAIQTFYSKGFDPKFLEQYDVDFLGENPWFDNLLMKSRDRFHTKEAEPEGFRKGGYFNEWVRPQGFDDTLGAVLEDGPDFHSWIGFVRRADREGFKNYELMNRLLPHLRRVLATRINLLEQDTATAGLRATFHALRTPALVLGADGQVQELNRAADALLKTGDIARLSKGGVFHLLDKLADRALQKALFDTARIIDSPDGPQAAPIILNTRDERYVGSVLPMRSTEGGQPVSVLFITEYSSQRPICVQGLRAAYELTPTEADLAVWLASGHMLKDFAEGRQMSLGTARWHLKNLEGKTGTRRAEELVALVRAVQLPVTTDADTVPETFGK